MSKIYDGGYAFPGVETYTEVIAHSRNGFETLREERTRNVNGMSLRDWFAGHALAALIAKAPFFDHDGEYGQPVDMVQFKADIAESAYSYADAMLAARDGGGK